MKSLQCFFKGSLPRAPRQRCPNRDHSHGIPCHLFRNYHSSDVESGSEKLSKLDRRSTLLLKAARENTETVDEKGAVGIEDPGMDALRGSFGTVGSIIRARTARRMSQSSNRNSNLRPPGAAAPHVAGTPSWMSADGAGLGGLTRHQLYDAPVPRADDEQSIHSYLANKRTAVKFGEQDLVHSYSRPGQGDLSVKHEH